MVSIFTPSGLANEPEITSKVTVCSQATVLMITSAIFIFMGTVIWGYGDLFFSFTQQETMALTSASGTYATVRFD